MVEKKKISQAIKEDENLRNHLLNNINDFEAKELRDKLPTVIDKPKLLKKFTEGDLTLDDAYQEAKPSDAQKRIRRAHNAIEPITKQELEKSYRNTLNAIKQDTRKLKREVDRITGMIEQISQ